MDKKEFEIAIGDKTIGGIEFVPFEETKPSEDELSKVIADLRINYEVAKGLKFVNDPVAYALYQTWKQYEGKRHGVKR